MLNLIKILCDNTGLSPSDIIQNINSAPISYKIYTIPKKNGGYRIIAQPTPIIKKIQRIIIAVFLSQFHPSSICTAYINKKSIIDNASAHKDNSWILKTDFKSFFPSIRPNDLFIFLEKNNVNLNEFDKKIISSFLFRKNKNQLELSIGAPSSPFISNLIMHEFDELMKNYCEEKSIAFTRYADDLTFSTNNFIDLKNLLAFLNENLNLLQSPKLTLNDKKTKIIGNGRSKRITGIIITHEGNLSIGRYSRKKIRAMLFNYKNNTIKNEDIPYLHGIVSHMRNIEPSYFKKLLNIYGYQFFIKLAIDSYKIGKAMKKNQIIKNKLNDIT